MKLRGSVEPYGPGAWKFTCECGGSMHHTSRPLQCTRVVVDSEVNFRCETPILSATQEACQINHQLAPLIAAYERKKKREDAEAYLAQMEEKKRAAMETLGITEADIVKPTITTSGEMK